MKLWKWFIREFFAIYPKECCDCGSDLKRTWDCANRIAKSLIDSGYINLPEPPEIKGE